MQIGSARVRFVNDRGAVLPALSGVSGRAMSWLVYRTPDRLARFVLVAGARPAILYELKRDLALK